VQRFKRYGLVVVAVGAAVGLVRVFGEASLWFVIAVLASSLFGGTGPGIAAIALSASVLMYFLAEPQTAVFLAAAVTVVALVEARCRANAKERQAEDTLSARLTVDRFPGMVVTLTTKGEPEFFNSRVTDYFRDYLGKTTDEMRDWTPLVHPEDRDRVFRTWMHSVATGESFDVEHRALTKDGNHRWHRSQALPMFDANERVVRWYNLITDVDDRKRAEEALRASELSYRMIVESFPGMVGTMTAAGEAEFANQQVLTFLGITLEELLDWPRFVHPDDRQRAVDLYLHAVETGQHLDFDSRVRRVDGVYRWMNYRGSVHRDEGGQVTRRYYLMTDIEDLKQAEEAARANELKFRLTIDNIPGMAFTCTSSGELEFVNKRVVEFFGKTLDELKDWSSFVHPEDRSRLVAQWTQSVGTGQILDEELRLRRADGSYGWAHSRHLPFREAEGPVIRWYCLITDIDERKRAEEALRASQQELSLIVETIPGYAWRALPEDGQPNYVSRRLLDFVGKSDDDFLRNGWHSFVHPDDRSHTVPVWTRSVATGEPFESRLRFRAADGSYRWFDARGELGRDDQGQPTGWYGLLIDIDDRVNLEEKLRGMQERLGQAAKTATLGELSAAIAHEVGQPLAALVANGHACLRWLSAQPPNLARAREAAERIARDGQEAGEIVRRIRALFKKVRFEKVKLDLNDVMREVLSPLRGEIAGRDIVVTTELPPGPLLVEGDRVQLQQLLLNLFHNAIDAMETVDDRPRILHVRSQRHGAKEVIVEVRDSGVGLTSPDQVFETFFTTKPNGMGMGLAVCRSIVEAHEGRLWASQPEGPGAVFSFTLPASSHTRQ
jgi:PAS domain S-box-containing protein